MILSTTTDSYKLIEESTNPIDLDTVQRSYLPIIKEADKTLKELNSQNTDKSKIAELKNWLGQIRDNIQKTYGNFSSEEYAKYLKELDSKIESLNNAIESTGKSSTLSFTQKSKDITSQDRKIQTDIIDYKEQAMTENISLQQQIIENLRRENSALKEANSALKEANSALKEANSALKEANLALKEENSTPKGENLLAEKTKASLLNVESSLDNQEPVIFSSSPSPFINLSSTDAQRNFPPPSPQSSNKIEVAVAPNQSSNVTTAGSTSVTASLVVVSDQNRSLIQTIEVDPSSSRSDIQNPDNQISEPGCFSKLKIMRKRFCGNFVK